MLALRAARELGLGPLTKYGLYRAMLQSGWLRWRTPLSTWDARPLTWWLRPEIPAVPEQYLDYRSSLPVRFFFSGDDHTGDSLRRTLNDGEFAAVSEADAILRGKFSLFGLPPISLGFPPDWNSFALHAGEETTPVDCAAHWASYIENDFPLDIKLLWEISRFGWVYPLLRAYWLTGSESYIDAIWMLIDSWREVNQPNAGPHWQSAQEVALRLLALSFVVYAAAPMLERSPSRLKSLAQMIAVHAERIPHTLIYARAQGNNHLLTEAVALYSTGILFPEFRQSRRWRETGRHWLVRALADQIFPDGGYVQHSTNYHRLALQIGLWAARIAEVNDDPLPTSAYEALDRTSQLLAALTDPENGRVPNFGPNDGAHILPLSTCPFEDYRPVVQSAACVLSGHPIFHPGPWDEACIWLGLDEKPLTTKARSGVLLYAKDGEHLGDPTDVGSVTGHLVGDLGKKDEIPLRRAGYPYAGLYLLRAERSWGMLRCAHFINRPGHSDQLHFDLWWQGQNVACDPGTYLYRGAQPWDNGLVGAGVHNTVIVDGLEPMRRVGRFLWLDWAQGRVAGRWRSNAGGLEILTAAHQGYVRIGVIHRRTIARAGSALWLVVDDLLGTDTHTVQVGWLLPDVPWTLDGRNLQFDLGGERAQIQIDGSDGTMGVYKAGTLIAGEAVNGDSPRWGWRARTYARKEPALRLVYQVCDKMPLRIVTWWIFDGVDPGALEIDWNPPGEGTAPISRIRFAGAHLDVDDAYSIDPSGLRGIE